MRRLKKGGISSGAIGSGIGSFQRSSGSELPVDPAPSWSVDPSITGVLLEGETLTGLDGTIADGAVTARQWRRDGTNIIGATGSTYDLTSDDIGAMILFRVTAEGLGGSQSKNSASVGPVEALPLPGNITDLAAMTMGDDIHLMWTPATDAISHEYRVNGGAWVATSDPDEQLVTGLTPDTEYDFEVRGVNAQGNGNVSNLVTETTLGGDFEPDPIPTPAITKTSDAGDVITFSVDALPYVVGYYWQLQLAGSNDFLTDYPTEADIRDEQRIVTIEDLNDEDIDGTVELDPFAILENQKAGLAYLRIRLGRDADDGLSIVWGTWSNVISDTVVVLTPTTFDATAAYSGTVLSNGNLTATSRSQNTGLHGKVRVTQSRAGKRMFQITIDAIPTGNIMIGVGPGSYAWTTLDGNYPGSAGTPSGISLSQAGVVLNNGASTSSVTPALTLGAIVTVCFDEPNDKVWYGYTAPAGSTITFNGDPAAGTGGFSPTGMTDWYAYVSMLVKSADQRTVTFNGGASAFVGTIPTGFVGYDL